MDTFWMPVKGYEGLYEISKEGQVRTLPRDVYDNDGNIVYRIGKSLITIHMNSDLNEKYAILGKDGKYNKEYVKDLLAASF